METPALERLIRRDQAIMLVGIAVLCALAWAWVVAGAGMGMPAAEMTRLGLFPHLGAMPMGGMEGMSEGGMGAMDAMPPMTALSDLPTFALMVSMWWVMMVAMMLPSAAPMMLLHARTVRHAQRKGRMAAGPALTGWLLGGYLTVWLAFSVAATLLQGLLQGSGAISQMMLWSETPWLSAGLLALAALYQVTPLKQVCLEHCRSPAEFLSRHWRPGTQGAFVMGLDHGAYCVGCCWALMLLLFVGGVMNLLWIAALALFVLLEKATPLGRASGWASAALLLAWSGATLMV